MKWNEISKNKNRAYDKSKELNWEICLSMIRQRIFKPKYLYDNDYKYYGYNQKGCTRAAIKLKDLQKELNFI